MSKETEQFIALQHVHGNTLYIRADSIVYMHEHKVQENGEEFANTTVRLADGFEIIVDVEVSKIIEAISEPHFFVRKDHVKRTKIITPAEHKPKRKHGVPVGYIGTAGVQALLNKSKGTIWRMILDGRLPKPLRDGQINIWDRKEILRWIDNAKFCKKR